MIARIGRRIVRLFTAAATIVSIIFLSIDMTTVGITVLFMAICASAVIYFDESAQRRAASSYPITARVPALPPPTGRPKESPSQAPPDALEESV